ncbi:toll/interleukin-1 receptor domain-containing protein [Longimicrobium sp.]|uniref:toll/interleukin-1 receptor domain-containing protein n=1 Tax=Longimicrobium sp. TaxID=2029185 RepID=UPI003B3AF2B8
MAEPTKVFVSYAQPDRSFAEALVFELDRAGVDVWSDRELRFGQVWEEQVSAALAEAKVFVLVVSPDYLTSNWSMVEMGAALARAREGATLVPVIAAPVALPAALSEYLALDAAVMSSAEIANRIRTITRES